MMIDYLTFCLTGSPGSVASFVPMGQDAEMTPGVGGGGSWRVRFVYTSGSLRGPSLHLY